MNIIKHGEQAQAELMTENFKCDQCGCEFSADNDEYYVEKRIVFYNDFLAGLHVYSNRNRYLRMFMPGVPQDCDENKGEDYRESMLHSNRKRYGEI
jgi:hypothetical protein